MSWLEESSNEIYGLIPRNPLEYWMPASSNQVRFGRSAIELILLSCIFPEIQVIADKIVAMKPISILLVAVFSTLALTAFSQDSTRQHPKHTRQHKHMMTYQCPMHPNEQSDKPGKCPKCGMDMKAMKTKAKPKA